MALRNRETRPEDAAERFARAYLAVEAELDWELLGRLYCDAEQRGGETFFSPEAVGALREAGLRIAADLGAALEGLPASGPGRGVYVGGAVAELAPALCEGLVLGRDVVLVNLPGPEAGELDRALRAAERGLERALPRIETDPERLPEACDHLWIASVFTDPEAFPAHHDLLYGRTGADAVGGGDLAAERAAADALLDRALARVVTPAVLSTTDEELALVRPACARRGLALAVPARARLSAVVGDPIRFCSLA